MVEPSAYRLGVGRAFYEIFAQSANGHTHLCAEVNTVPRNGRSLAFHDALGFEALGEFSGEGPVAEAISEGEAQIAGEVEGQPGPDAHHVAAPDKRRSAGSVHPRHHVIEQWHGALCHPGQPEISTQQRRDPGVVGRHRSCDVVLSGGGYRCPHG